MENLRYMLYQYNTNTALYIGCRFTGGTDEGFHAGFNETFDISKNDNFP